MRTVHPPTCPHPSCNGKTFSAQKGLRAHLKIHEQRDIEEGLRDGRSVEPDEDQDEDEPLKKKKRRGGEVGRDFICEYEDCDKDFKSKKALTNHHNVNHLGRRDFVCTHADCKRAFGYKHLLQRHITRDHIPQSDDEGSESSDEEVEEEAPQHPASFSIDDITGLTYSMHAKEQMQETAKLACPHPDVSPLTGAALAVRHPKCQYIFSRAYDLRRHLRSEHGLDVTKERVDEWVRRARKAKTSEA
ncbi:hypothetical protein EUX98_g6 [Antrodiella citrinella]|uniref:C2H2-type domain-containing protein n=1 Tax=Antrodiella citrinella TaxID=2447956 RepID=A0A4S4N724_9APHY|nr:hypothetical protein EUX98_g6 [Antrodiella citrinella]